MFIINNEKQLKKCVKNNKKCVLGRRATDPATHGLDRLDPPVIKHLSAINKIFRRSPKMAFRLPNSIERWMYFWRLPWRLRRSPNPQIFHAHFWQPTSVVAGFAPFSSGLLLNSFLQFFDFISLPRVVTSSPKHETQPKNTQNKMKT